MQAKNTTNKPQETIRVCATCCYLKGKRCRCWDVKVADPNDSHCEVWNHWGTGGR